MGRGVGRLYGTFLTSKTTPLVSFSQPSTSTPQCYQGFTRRYDTKSPAPFEYAGLVKSDRVGIRTPNLLIRSEVLYPVELHSHSPWTIPSKRGAKIPTLSSLPNPFSPLSKRGPHLPFFALFLAGCGRIFATEAGSPSECNITPTV